MTRHRVAALVVGLLALAGCSTTAPPDTAAANSASAEAEADLPPEPDAGTRAAYIEALNALDPAIVHGDEDRAVDRGRDQCGGIKQFPNDRTKLVNQTRQRFSGSTLLSGAQAGQVLDVVHRYLCPGY